MSKLVYTGSNCSVAAQLTWSVFDGNPRRRRDVRRTAVVVDGFRYVLVDQGDHNLIGLATGDGLDGRISKAKRLYSYALLCNAFLHQADDDVGVRNGIFVMTLEHDVTHRCVCVIRNSEIVYDVVETRDRAAEIAAERFQEFGGLCKLFASADELDEPLTDQITWDDLVAHADSNSLLLNVPASPMVFIGLGVTLLAIASGLAYWYMVEVPLREAERLKKLAEADKTPIYLRALKKEAQSTGWTQASMRRALDGLGKKPYILPDGWRLAKVHCDVQGCKDTWAREGGDLNGLVAKNRAASLQNDPKLQADVAATIWKAEVEASHIDLQSLPLATDELQRAIKPVMQQLDNAGVRVLIGKPAPWPPSAPVTGVKKSVIVTAQPVKVEAPFPLGSEVLGKFPASVVFNGFTLELTNPRTFTLTIEGNSYAR